MARKIIYRDYRKGKSGQFSTEAAYNRSRAQGVRCHIHREYVNTDVIASLDDLEQYEDYPDDELDEYEFHATGDTGRSQK